MYLPAHEQVYLSIPCIKYGHSDTHIIIVTKTILTDGLIKPTTHKNLQVILYFSCCPVWVVFNLIDMVTESVRQADSYVPKMTALLSMYKGTVHCIVRWHNIGAFRVS